MGSSNTSPQLPVAFNNQVFPAGLDLGRCDIRRALGHYRSTAATSYRAGMGVMLDSTGNVVVSDGTAVLGIAKFDKMTLGKSVVVNESVTFGSSAATKTLNHPSISNIVVRVGTAMTSTTYAVTTDYTLNTTNGTITHVASGSGGSIAFATPVYVSYTWSLTASDQAYNGTNFWNTQDAVTAQDLRITVIQPDATLYTTEFDTSQAYALTGATSNIYIGSAGIFTSSSSSAKLVGHCVKLPTAGDPFIGVEFLGTVVAQT